MTNDITIDCSTATLNFKPQYYYLGAFKIVINVNNCWFYVTLINKRNIKKISRHNYYFSNTHFIMYS